MTPGKVYGASKLENFSSKIVFLNAPIRKENPPMFENDLKWPTSEQQLKVKIIYRKGVLNRPKSLVLLNVVSFNQKRLEYSQKLQFVNSIYIC